MKHMAISGGYLKDLTKTGIWWLYLCSRTLLYCFDSHGSLLTTQNLVYSLCMRKTENNIREVLFSEVFWKTPTICSGFDGVPMVYCHAWLIRVGRDLSSQMLLQGFVASCLECLASQSSAWDSVHKLNSSLWNSLWVPLIRLYKFLKHI